ncbi:MAG: DUF6470 family protein [Anaerovoracaceae bacterium]
MEQLLGINITRGTLRMHTRQGQFQKTGADGDSQAQLQIRKQPGGGLKMKRTPAKLELNTGEVLDSVRPWKWTTITAQIREKGHQAGMEAIAVYARQADAYQNPDVNEVTQESKACVLKDADQWWGLDWTPKVQAESRFTPEKLDFSYKRDEVSVDVKKGESPYTYRPGGTEIQCDSPGGVSFTWLGKPNYFPTGKHIDRRV